MCRSQSKPSAPSRIAQKARAAVIRHEYRIAANEYRQWLDEAAGPMRKRATNRKTAGTGVEPAPG